MKSRNGHMMKILEQIIPFFLGFVIIFGILVKTGTLHSGYHFIDDHELVRMKYVLDEGRISAGHMIIEAIKIDLTWRFRPLYWVERVCGVVAFGTTMYLWNIYTAIKGVLTFGFLMLAARNMRCNRIVGFLFAAIIIVGTQFTPWYRSANQESTGLLLLSLSMLISSITGFRKSKSYFVLDICNLLIIAMCGLVKESFTLTMPAMIAFHYWMSRENRTDPQPKKAKWNLFLYSVVLILFLLYVVVIIFGSGVDNVSYAGFHQGVSIKTYFYGIRDSLLVYMKWYYFMGILLLALVIISYEEIKRWLNHNWVPLLTGLFIMVIQMIAHARSLMWERYLIPFTVGYSLVFVVLGYKYFASNIIKRRIYTSFLLILLLLEFPLAYKGAENYAYDGKVISSYLNEIVQNVDSTDTVVAAFQDEELNLSSASWLETQGITNVFSYNEKEEAFVDLVQLVGKNEPGDANWSEVEYVLCYTSQVDEFIAHFGSTKHIENNQYGKYCIIKCK